MWDVPSNGEKSHPLSGKAKYIAVASQNALSTVKAVSKPRDPESQVTPNL